MPNNRMIFPIIFWSCFAILFYSYIGYGILLYLLNKPKIIEKNPTSAAYTPDITIVIPSFNEADFLIKKIENTLGLNYPANKLFIIVVADGSDDDSLNIIKKYPQITALYHPQRKGKAAAINHAMQQVQTPVVVFSDANSILNKDSLQNIVGHFNTDKVGGVAGEKRIYSTDNGVGQAEGLYWQYESLMKKLDADFYTVIGAAGELFAMRTSLFHPMDESIILDDLFLSMKICLQGYIIAYEPNAFAEETPTISLHEEEKRKIRIAAGAFQAVNSISIKNLLHYPKVAFQYFSRRWLRWVVSPIAILLLLITNILLAIWFPASVYSGLLVVHILFYLFAVAGWYLIKTKRTIVWTTVPFYFLFMNYCMLRGLIFFMQGKYTVLWQKSARQV